MSSGTDTFFAILAAIAGVLFAAVIALQVIEWKYYEDARYFGESLWPATMASAQR